MLPMLRDLFASFERHEVRYNEITIFMDRLRVDVQTRTPGVDFEASWARRADMAYRDQTIHVLARQDLIASKKAAGRPVDLQDVEQLEGGTDA